MGICNDIWQSVKRSSMLMRIIYINIGVFVVLRLLAVIGVLMNLKSPAMVLWVEVPSQPAELLSHPWTLITYMFSHFDVIHILFNMLWFYWLGRIFMEYFNGKRLTALYVLGGLGGAAMFVLAYNTLPYFENRIGLLIGASASVMAVAVAIAVYAPNYKINLLFFGGISLKWLVIAYIGFDVLSISENDGVGHIAHLGGALVGLSFALAMKQGHDITAWLNALVDKIAGLFKHKPKGPRMPKRPKKQPSAPQQQNTTAKRSATSDEPTEDEIDAILDKLKRSGYGALSDSEKDTLFKASRKR